MTNCDQQQRVATLQVELRAVGIMVCLRFGINSCAVPLSPSPSRTPLIATREPAAHPHTLGPLAHLS